MEQPYDLVIIGAGPGGYEAALKAAKLGKRTAVVEKRNLGGTCLNRGCIPMKTLLHTSLLYRELREASRFGICCGEPELDMAVLWQHKEDVVQSLREGIAQMFGKHKVTLFEGCGRVVSRELVEVTGNDGTVTTIAADHILIASGSVPAVPPIPGAEMEGVINSDDILEDNRLGGEGRDIYKRLIIIGGGVIGMEMATVYSDLSCEVTVLEAMERILPGMDKEISQNLKMILKKRGVDIHTSAMVKELVSSGRGIICRFEEKGIVSEVEADGVLISTGRKPVTTDLFSEELAVQIRTERGFLCVDEHFRTEVPGIYAVGDVIGGIQLAHMATAEGVRAVEHMFGLPPSQNMQAIPSCVYTDPEIASVGITADEAKAAGIAVKTGKYIMSVNGKSVLSKQERGFIKLIASEETEALLGAQLMCARATDMIGELGLSIASGLKARDLAAVVMAHPTFGEGIGAAAAALLEE